MYVPWFLAMDYQMPEQGRFFLAPSRAKFQGWLLAGEILGPDFFNLSSGFKSSPSKWARMPGGQATHFMLIQVNVFMGRFPVL